MVLAGVVIIVLVVFVKVLQVVLIELLERKGLAREPVDRPGNELLLDVLAELVVELQALLNIRGGIVILIVRGLGRREEVEEGLGGNSLLDNAGLLGGWFLSVDVFSCKWLDGTYSCCAASSVRRAQSGPGQPSSRSCRHRRGRR
jgi:hypothetical protein